MNPKFQLILLPGLGSDYRLLEPQRAAFPQLIVPPWIPPRKNESLPQYAARMAETVSPLRDVPFVLGGVSFGGMLAYEMARYLKPDAVVLIASCRTRESLRPIYSPGRWLLPVLPARIWDVAKLVAGPVMRTLHRKSPAKCEMLVAMFRESDSRFMHWVVQAILNWESTPLEGIPVFHIHGRRDPVIPARRLTADVLIANGRHLINVTHADEINNFIIRATGMSQKTQVFREDALAYCELLDSLADGKSDHFYERLLACMSRLAKIATELPCDCCLREIEGEGHLMTHEEWGEIIAQLNQTLGPEIQRLIEADEKRSDSDTRVFMLTDSLADIYRDLHAGLDCFDHINEGGIQEATWQWKFSYEHHWGSHLFDALHTIHRIRYELGEE